MGGMFRSVVFSVLIIGVLGEPDSPLKKWLPFQRKTVTIADVPYQVSLRRLPNETLICGGTLISYDTVLTAAQCVLDENGILINVKDLMVAAGQSSLSEKNTGLKIPVTRIIPHAEFNKLTLEDDIALIKLRDAVPNNLSNVQWVALRNKSIIEDCVAKASAWGFEGSSSNKDYLQIYKLIIEKNEECPVDIDTEQLCAGSPWINAKKEDSGGPLTCDGSLIGIISIASPPKNPQIFTNVSSYLNWINEATKIPEVYPYQVSLRYKDNDTHFCSGSLINGTDIITLAQCVMSDGNDVVNKSDIIIRSGDIRSEENVSNDLYEVSEIRIHPKYDGTKHNVAVIKLVEEITSNHTYLKWIKISEATAQEDTLCISTGWKDKSSPYATVAFIDDYPNCSEKDRVFCAETKYVAENDSASDFGGALVCGNKLTGIFTSKYSSSYNIGHYVNVAKYAPWILNDIDTTDKDEENSSGKTTAIPEIVTMAAVLYMLFLF